MGKNYAFLRAARTIFKVLAWGVLALCVVAGMAALTAKAPLMGPGVPAIPKAVGVVYILYGGFFWLISYTISEIIGLLLDIKASSGRGEG